MSNWHEYFETRYQPDKRRTAVWRSICGWLQREISDTATVLEIGAGYCDFINNICANRKLALDIHQGFRQSADANVETYVGSCTQLDFIADSSIDAVFASNLLEHLELADVEATLREVRRVLKPGGKLLVIQPNFRFCFREYFDDYTHRSVFTDRSLSDLFAAAGFDITRVEPKFMPFSLRSGLPVHPALVKIYLRSPWRPRAGQMLVVACKPGR